MAQTRETHTPGPWRVEEPVGMDGNPHPRVYGPNNFDPLPLAEVWDGRGLANGHRGDLEEIRANARLIAAAPELLSALRDMVAHCYRCDGTAEAEGDDSTMIECPDCEQARAALAKAEG